MSPVNSSIITGSVSCGHPISCSDQSGHAPEELATKDQLDTVGQTILEYAEKEDPFYPSYPSVGLTVIITCMHNTRSIMMDKI